MTAQGHGQQHEMAQRYLAELRRHLRALPETERDDASREIASHLAESQTAGQPVSAVLGRLGEPAELARSYLADYYLRSAPRGRWDALRREGARLGLTLGAGVASVILVPFLGMAAVTLALAAVLSPLLGVVRTFGASWIVLGSSTGWQVPYAWSFPVLVGLGIVCAVLAWGAARLLQLYVSVVLAGYRRVLPSAQG